MVAAVVSMTGCWQSRYVYYHDILVKSPTTWSRTEARSVIEANMELNRYDSDSPYRILATRFTPVVIAAINRLEQEGEGWSWFELFRNMNLELERYTGLHVDPISEAILDSHNRPYRDERQLDSIAFLIGVYDLGAVAGLNSDALAGSIFDLKNYTFNDPDVYTFREKIVLENSRGEWLKPEWLAGTEEGELVGGRNLLIMFRLNQKSFHFLQGSTSMTIVVRGFSRDVRLPFLLDSGNSPAGGS
jgi:hypothetical protein